MRIRSRLFLWGERLIERDAKFLAPLSWGWRFFSFCKNVLYDRCLLPTVRVPKTVVSIGNLVAGGTGKTPLVQLLAERFAHKRVAIVLRGYGEVPDEALLLKRRLKGARVYVGRDRVHLAERAIEEGADLILLDDGFQYRKLHRNIDCVLLSASDPFGRGHFLPRGLLRDSPKRLGKADALFVSGEKDFRLPTSIPKQTQKLDSASVGQPLNLSPPASLNFSSLTASATLELVQIQGASLAYSQLLNSFRYIRLKLQVERVLDRRETAVPSIKGWKVGLFSGIAKPAAFKKTVQGLGAQILFEWRLADHEVARPKALLAFAEKCREGGAEALVCTEKDFVKISSTLSLPLPLLFPEISWRIEEGREMWEKLIAKIEQNIENCS